MSGEILYSAKTSSQNESMKICNSIKIKSNANNGYFKSKISLLVKNYLRSFQECIYGGRERKKEDN